ncbi:MAG TPA: phosphatase, partial [Armatimonadota bacterium]|nr:phosphatase [Armatimonadota bacterium]
MSSRPPCFFGVMHIGSEQVSLQIVEYISLQDMRIVEKAATSVSLGEETFKTGKISFAAVRELCDLLKGYRRIMNEYGVKDYLLMATTAIREAENQQYIIDQIKVKTGFTVDVVDMPQEIFHKYIALFRDIEGQGLADEQDGILFVDISSGGLAFTLYEAGKLAYQQNIHIGALRIKESFEKYQRESVHFPQALTEYINSTIDLVGVDLNQHTIKYLVLSGAETSLLLKLLGRDEGTRLSYLGVDEFRQLYERVKCLNLAHLMRDFSLNEHRAEMVLPTMVLYDQILTLSNAAQIIISNAQFNDGICIAHIGEKTGDKYLATIEDQIISFAHALGRKYQH